MKSYAYWLSAIIIGAFIGLSGLGDAIVDTAWAQDSGDTVMPARRVSLPEATPERFLNDWTARIDETTGCVKGPMDIIVGVSDKAANGFKYTNVPFYFSGNGFITFPNGDLQGKNPVYVITSNYTVRLK